MNAACFYTKNIARVVICSIGIMATEHAAAQKCAIRLSESTMNFGRIIAPGSSAPQPVGNLHPLGSRMVGLNASCPTSATPMLVMHGEAYADQFKFARSGHVRVQLSNALLDGRRVDLAQASSGTAAPDRYGSSIEAMPGDRIIPISGGLPAQGSVLSLQVEVRPLLPTSELRTRDAKTLEAHLAFQVQGF
ncbi:DUF1120 domain-containing protein [Pseudomonas defluvii]|uniref:hypothetical protein n=1 Tax=Pseudomonas defluvii TaxID=1876757 RepID=UPI003906704E